MLHKVTKPDTVELSFRLKRETSDFQVFLYSLFNSDINLLFFHIYNGASNFIFTYELKSTEFTCMQNRYAINYY